MMVHPVLWQIGKIEQGLFGQTSTNTFIRFINQCLDKVLIHILIQSHLTPIVLVPMPCLANALIMCPQFDSFFF
ncbi:hypothetical protein EVA_03133 [gut metagenome]|uniref:Uncharacterized protein n=1 Tax=gut metagenome TaxID=749906 RepID=J9D7K8_9ZZZZ